MLVHICGYVYVVGGVIVNLERREFVWRDVKRCPQERGKDHLTAVRTTALWRRLKR